MRRVFNILLAVAIVAFLVYVLINVPAVDRIILILSAVVCWPLAGWMFWKWDLGGYRSDYERRKR
jgi:membrane-bound acyltransferase YfiQ involved in biofilm formation